jgi:hypothetical protein
MVMGTPDLEVGGLGWEAVEESLRGENNERFWLALDLQKHP